MNPVIETKRKCMRCGNPVFVRTWHQFRMGQKIKCMSSSDGLLIGASLSTMSTICGNCWNLFINFVTDGRTHDK
jgi:DNA-directed RNA polymerase subunit RPC12/RpoP